MCKNIHVYTWQEAAASTVAMHARAKENESREDSSSSHGVPGAVACADGVASSLEPGVRSMKASSSQAPQIGKPPPHRGSDDDVSAFSFSGVRSMEDSSSQESMGV